MGVTKGNNQRIPGSTRMMETIVTDSDKETHHPGIEKNTSKLQAQVAEDIGNWCYK